MANVMLRLRAVMARTGLSRSSIYLRISVGSFPRQVRLGERSVGWLEHEVEEWIRAAVARRDVDASKSKRTWG
jgi:prophage regulatory protein